VPRPHQAGCLDKNSQQYQQRKDGETDAKMYAKRCDLRLRLTRNTLQRCNYKHADSTYKLRLHYMTSLEISSR